MNGLEEDTERKPPLVDVTAQFFRNSFRLEMQARNDRYCPTVVQQPIESCFSKGFAPLALQTSMVAQLESNQIDE